MVWRENSNRLGTRYPSQDPPIVPLASAAPRLSFAVDFEDGGRWLKSYSFFGGVKRLDLAMVACHGLKIVHAIPPFAAGRNMR